MMHRCSLAIVLVSVLSACATSVAIVDGDFGYERGHGGLAARVPAEHSVIDAAKHGPASNEITVQVPGFVPSAGVGDAAAFYKFALRLKLYNDTDADWPFSLGNIELQVRDPNDIYRLHPVDRVSDGSTTTVPPNDVQEFEVPIYLQLPDGVTMLDVERFWLRLQIRDNPGGDVILNRRLVIETWNPFPLCNDIFSAFCRLW